MISSTASSMKCLVVRRVNQSQGFSMAVVTGRWRVSYGFLRLISQVIHPDGVFRRASSATRTSGAELAGRHIHRRPGRRVLVPSNTQRRRIAADGLERQGRSPVRKHADQPDRLGDGPVAMVADRAAARGGGADSCCCGKRRSRSVAAAHRAALSRHGEGQEQRYSIARRIQDNPRRIPETRVLTPSETPAARVRGMLAEHGDHDRSQLHVAVRLRGCDKGRRSDRS